jgi:DNA mismatch repair ATPase MutS
MVNHIPMKEYAPIVLFEQLKAKYPKHIIFIQCGYYYDVYDEDARECNRLFNWKIYKRGELDYTGTSRKSTKFKDALKSMNHPYIIVDQYIENEYLKRKVVEIFPDK